MLRRYLPKDLAEEILRVAPSVIASVGDISRRLQRASKQGSRVRLAYQPSGKRPLGGACAQQGI